MTVRHFSTYTSADTTLVTTAETVVATLSGLSTNQAGQSIDFHGSATITTGTATTQLTLRVREDSLTGALVGEAIVDTIESSAGSTETHTTDVQHPDPGEFSGKTYVLTVAQTAATANGSALQAALLASVKP